MSAIASFHGEVACWNVSTNAARRQIQLAKLGPMGLLQRTARLLLLAAAITARNRNNSSELTCTEGVRLLYGRVLTLKRWVEFKGGSGHSGDPSAESQQTVDYDNRRFTSAA